MKKRIPKGKPILQAEQLPTLLMPVMIEDRAAPALYKFLDAAAEYFAGVTPSVPGRAMQQALTLASPATEDRRTALGLCWMLAQRFVGPAKPGTRAFFLRLRDVSKPLGLQGPGPARDAAYSLAADLVERAARKLPRARKYDRELAGDGHHERMLAIELVGALAFDVEPKFRALATDDGLALVLERLGRFDPAPKGKRGKLSASGVLAPLIQQTRAFGHTRARPEEKVRKAVEAGIARHAKARREANVN